MNVDETFRADRDPATSEPLAPRVGLATSDRLDWHEIAAMFNRRLKLFVIVAFVIFEIAQVLTWRMPTRYTATADVALIRVGDQVAPKGSSVVSDEQKSDDVDTEVQVITSRELAGKVADKLGLVSVPDYGARRRSRDVAIDRLIANLAVERVKSAFVISLAFEDAEPKRAAKIVNTFAHIYTQQQIDVKREANNRATAFLANQIAQLRTQAQNDMRAVQDYRIANDLLSTGGTTLSEQEISAYNQQVALAKAEAAQDFARLGAARSQVIRGTNGADIGQSLASPVIQGLRQQRATISARVADLSSHYGNRYPDLIQARSQLRDVDLQIQTEVLRELSSLGAQSRVSAQRLASLQSSLGVAHSALARNNRAMTTLDDLTRRSSTSQALYETYLDRYKSVAAQAGTEASNARLLSEAAVPTSPTSPHVFLNLALGLLIGLGLGATAAIATELFYTGFTTGDEIERRLGLRYLGGVPALHSIKPRESTPLATVEQFPRSVFAESFKAILASLRHGSVSPHRVIAVTSALPGEGKSTLAICLAAAGSIGTNDRILAIDLDVARHRLSDQTVVDKTRPGLRAVLRDGASVDEALIQIANSKFYVLPITAAFEKDEQITRGGLVHELVARLRDHFSLIILDCPPLLPVAEARDLVALADDVILVAAWRRTKENALHSAIRLLPTSIRAKTGVALTKIDLKKQARFGAGDATSFYKQYRDYYAA